MGEDRIVISDLLVRGILGVHDRERDTPRDILLNVVLVTDVRRAAATDALADTVDYETVVGNITRTVEASSRRTVEALANDVAEVCLGEPTVTRVRVRVDKPGALSAARSVAVEIERSRGD